MQSPSPRTAAKWVIDYALVGGVTAFLAPFVAIGAILDNFGVHGLELYYVPLTLSGAVCGAGMGWLLQRLVGRGLRFEVPTFFMMAFLGALCGGMVGAIGGCILPRSGHLLTASCGAVAGALQLGWFWYPHARRTANQRGTSWLVLAACGLSSVLGIGAIRMLQLITRFLDV